MRRALVLALALTATALAGCVKAKQKAVVLPDGSGKLSMTMGISTPMLAMAKQAGGAEGKDPFDELGQMSKNSEGFVAWTKPVTEEKDGFTYFSLTGYFEDINKVRTFKGAKGEEAERKAELAFKFAKQGEGWVLDVVSASLGDDKEKEEEIPPEMEEMTRNMMAAMMKGLEITESYEMPGVVSSAEGLPTKDGRVASLSLTDKDLADPKAMKAFQKAKTRKIVCGPSSWSEAETKAFKEELAKAKEEWAKLKAAAAATGPAPAKPEEKKDEGGGK